MFWHVKSGAMDNCNTLLFQQPRREFLVIHFYVNFRERIECRARLFHAESFYFVYSLVDYITPVPELLFCFNKMLSVSFQSRLDRILLRRNCAQPRARKLE